LLFHTSAGCRHQHPDTDRPSFSARHPGGGVISLCNHSHQAVRAHSCLLATSCPMQTAECMCHAWRCASHSGARFVCPGPPLMHQARDWGLQMRSVCALQAALLQRATRETYLSCSFMFLQVGSCAAGSPRLWHHRKRFCQREFACMGFARVLFSLNRGIIVIMASPIRRVRCSGITG